MLIWVHGTVADLLLDAYGARHGEHRRLAAPEGHLMVEVGGARRVVVRLSWTPHQFRVSALARHLAADLTANHFIFA